MTMRYRQAPPATAGVITTGLRQRFEVEENEEGERTFEVPSDLDTAAHQRLIEAGHEPLEPEELPSGVTYNEGASEESASGSESGSSNEPTDTPSESEEDEEAASGGESEPGRIGSMTSDAFAADEAESDSADEPEGEPAEPPAPLDEMNRSELYQYGNEELNLELEWSGEDALNEEEMRSRIEEEIGNDGE